MRCRRDLQRIRITRMDAKNKRTSLRIHKNLKHRFPNITIKELRELYVEYGKLDPTFKWQRDLKTIQFDAICTLLDLSIETMATKVICLKYPNGVPSYVSIYPHQLDF
ncbi:hypothetical protein ACQVST_26310 [Bacillus cereus]|uniref:hypothetical protein n=1 Tax=Bacillus TaxID=1386 RepID=UPI0030F6E29C